MKISAILKEKGFKVVTLRSDTSLEEALKALAKNRIGAVVVFDAQDQIAGVFSERDSVRALANEGASALKREISHLMTRKVVSCSGDDDLDRALELMTKGRFRHLPVVEGGQLSGIISIGDVVKYKIASTESEAEALREYITTS